MKGYLFVLLAFLFLASCANDKPANSETAAVADSDEEEFLQFRKKFLRDSIYQMEHITFPLDGIPDKEHAADTMPNGMFFWQEETWLMHKEIDPARSGFEVSYKWLTDNLVEETLINPQVGLGMMRRFVKRGEKWELIYYVGMNSVKQQ